MKPLSESDLLRKLEVYCAYQERCEKEVIEKLKKLEATQKQVVEILQNLKESNFINEQRFAEVYARSKFGIKKWGRIKITFELKLKNIPEKSIQQALKQINTTEYLQVIAKLANAKKKSIKELDKFKLNQKTALYLLSKGFESELIWKELNKKQT